MNTPARDEKRVNRLRTVAYLVALSAAVLLSGCAQPFAKIGQTKRIAVTLPCARDTPTTLVVDDCKVKQVLSGHGDDRVEFNGLDTGKVDVTPRKFTIPAGKKQAEFTIRINDRGLRGEELFFIVREKADGKHRPFLGIYSVATEPSIDTCCYQGQQIRSGAYTPIGVGKH